MAEYCGDFINYCINADHYSSGISIVIIGNGQLKPDAFLLSDLC